MAGGLGGRAGGGGSQPLFTPGRQEKGKDMEKIGQEGRGGEDSQRIRQIYQRRFYSLD